QSLTASLDARTGYSLMTYDPATAVSWKIHPAIGFARVGNSQSAHFVGHEAMSECALPLGGHRDSGDVAALRLPAIKRQAALFRVYAYDGAGTCLGEAAKGTVKPVEWQVTLANKKAAGPQIGRDKGRPRPRNEEHPPQERWRLEITPQPRRVAGADQRA